MLLASGVTPSWPRAPVVEVLSHDLPYSSDPIERASLLCLQFHRYFTENLLIDGNKAVQIITMARTQRGDFCGFPPTGKGFRMRCAFLFPFEDDRIAYEFQIYDFTGILAQLGVLKAKPVF